MKKLTTILFIFLFSISCYSETDPLYKGKIYSVEKLNVSSIALKLNYFLNKYEQKWTKQQKSQAIRALYLGQKEFNIDYKIVMSIIAIESNYNIKAKNKKSNDYGLTQQNNRYTKQRYLVSKKYLDKYKIKYNIKNKYDVSLNIFSCYLYLKELEQTSNTLYFPHYIGAYNVGYRGLEKNSSIAYNYYIKFMKEYMSI